MPHSQDNTAEAPATLNHISELDYRRWAKNPKQDRSQESLERILDAALHQLLESGTDSLSVATVAERAGYTVGALYRRFADKKSMLHAVHERFAENILEILKMVAEQFQAEESTISDLVELLAEQAWAFAVQHQAFLQLANIFAQNDKAFVNRRNLISKASEDILKPLFLARSHEISHPNPEQAIRFVFEQSMAAFSYRVESMGANNIISLMDDDQFIEELKFCFYTYLGIKPNSNQ